MRVVLAVPSYSVAASAGGSERSSHLREHHCLNMWRPRLRRFSQVFPFPLFVPSSSSLTGFIRFVNRSSAPGRREKKLPSQFASSCPYSVHFWHEKPKRVVFLSPRYAFASASVIMWPCPCFSPSYTGHASGYFSPSPRQKHIRAAFAGAGAAHDASAHSCGILRWPTQQPAGPRLPPKL